MPPSVESARARPYAVETASSTGWANYALQVLRGNAAILAEKQAISDLRERTGQSDNPLLGVDFFLKRVALFPGNRPVVLLIRSPDGLQGAVYLYEKTFFGIPTGYLRGFDHFTGESSVIAHAEVRTSILRLAIQQLFIESKAQVAWATVNRVAPETHVSQAEMPNLHVETSSMGREHRLKLADTFDATLTRFGPHTRRNLRYYRRRAEKDLKVSFHPSLTSAQSDEALQQLSKRSFQPFSVSLREWRKMDRLTRNQPGHFAMGLRAGEQWISYLVGMRIGNLTYVLVQINHNGFSRYSLSTVLRAYFFEHEIARRQDQIKFVNGTNALFQRCCESDTCVTVSARRGFPAFVLFQWIAPWHSAPDHALNMQRWTSMPEPRA